MAAVEVVDEREEEELEAIRKCRSINGKTLDISNKKLKVLPNEVLKLSQIQNLYLQENLLEEIPFHLCEKLPQLTWLDLRHNKLKSLPHNISLLRCIKNLLLEGNQIKQLPLELGLLTNLRGLNLKENPLEFPPKNIIEQGVKIILKYLREQSLDILQCMKHTIHDCNIDESDNNNGTRDVLHDGISLRKLRLHSAMPSTLKKLDSYFEADSGYLRREPIQTTYHREVEDAERRKVNDETDAMLQKRRDKVVLSEWRKEASRLQYSKRRSTSAPQHELMMPYANDILPQITPEKKSDFVDVELDDRIKVHIDNIKQWSNKDKAALTIDQQVETAKQNLEKVIELRKEVADQRNVQERINANQYSKLINTSVNH